jgi:hypothetical protein
MAALDYRCALKMLAGVRYCTVGEGCVTVREMGSAVECSKGAILNIKERRKEGDPHMI